MSYMNNNFNPAKHTLFQPKNPEKYKGDINKIVSRSSYETKFYKWCDTNDNIISWNSEGLVIPYFDPIKNKQRRYFVDVLFKCICSDNIERVYAVEIKPYNQTIPPRKSKRKSKNTIIKENTVWITNQAKWKAAKKYCELKGWYFKIVTERELF